MDLLDELSEGQRAGKAYDEVYNEDFVQENFDEFLFYGDGILKEDNAMRVDIRIALRKALEDIREHN